VSPSPYPFPIDLAAALQRADPDVLALVADASFLASGPEFKKAAAREVAAGFGPKVFELVRPHRRRDGFQDTLHALFAADDELSLRDRLSVLLVMSS
jgi:hypothetical protein